MQQQEYRPGQDPITTNAHAKAYLSWIVPEQLQLEAIAYFLQLRQASGGFPLIMAVSMVMARIKRHAGVATCEACQHLYMQAFGYYEPGEYSYCATCCKW